MAKKNLNGTGRDAEKIAGVPKNILALGLVSFFTDVSSEMIFPLIPIMMTTFMGAGREIVGMMEGIADSIASAAPNGRQARGRSAFTNAATARAC